MQIAFTTTQTDGTVTNYCRVISISCVYPALPQVSLAYFVNKTDTIPAGTNTVSLDISMIDISQAMTIGLALQLINGPLYGGTIVT